MNTPLKVLDFFRTSIGDIVIIELSNEGVIINKGDILKNDTGCSWKVEGIGMGGKINSKASNDNAPLLIDLKIKVLLGDCVIKKNDLLFLTT